jgi:polysaccharide export outer membrane protein
MSVVRPFRFEPCDGCWVMPPSAQRMRDAARVNGHPGLLALAIMMLTMGGEILLAAQPRPYVVGPNDVLAVTVFNQPQLTGKYVVEADGMFTFPLLGRVSVGGLTLRAVEDHLRERLAKGYLKDPQVSVVIEKYRSQHVYVMGEVRQPGAFELSGPITLVEALARAASTTDRAGNEALIVRSSNGAVPDAATVESASGSTDAPVIRVNLQSLQTGTLSQNVALWPGDTVFVPRAEPVVVSGHVKTPGEYFLRRSMTVRQVIALAGGVTERGSTRRIQILRLQDGVEKTISADLKDQVQPGDTIVVRERLF